jgi:hypothetical protein
VVWTVQGERGIGVSKLRCGGSWMGSSCGDSFEVLKDAVEDIGSTN